MSELPSVADPTIVLDLLESYRRSKTMFAAVSLGIFDALEKEPATAETLAERLGLHADALGRLLDACVCLKLIDKSADLYANSRVAQTYLTSASPRRLTGYIGYSNDVLWKMWANLEGAIREGTHRWKETFGWDGPIFSNFFRTEESKREFLMGMHGYGLISSPEVVAAFDLGSRKRLVDLGGATGHLAIAACERYPRLQATVFDLADVVPLTREIVGRSPAASRIEIRAGDFFVDPLPEGDVFALGRILHDWTEEKILVLLKRIYDRLPIGGSVLVAEKLIDPDRSGPRWALMQHLGMLIYTEGRERTAQEYESLLKSVGFAEVEHKALSGGVPLDAVLATKA
jgi:acetylserotonin N-methyltransferase